MRFFLVLNWVIRTWKTQIWFFCPHNPKHLTLVFPTTKVWQCLQKSSILGWIFPHLLEAQSSVGKCSNEAGGNTSNWWKLTSGFLPAHPWFFPLSKSLLQSLQVYPHNFRLERILCRMKIPIFSFFFLLVMSSCTGGPLGNYPRTEWGKRLSKCSLSDPVESWSLQHLPAH